MSGETGTRARDSLFLPDFCDIRVVFLIVIVGELLAFTLVLAPVGRSGDRWHDLALVSLFVQWVGLTSAGLLCVGRRWMRPLNDAAAGAVGYAVILAVTAALSEGTYHLMAEGLIFSDPPPERRARFLLENLAISAIVGAVALRFLFLQFHWRQRLESETRARIQALQSRIRPHFLFNSMNTVASLTRSRPELAERIIEDLADLFRASLGDAQVPVTLESEISLCRQYVEIEALRVGSRLSVEWSLNGLPTDALLPALCLQPLVENAIYHGIEPLPEGGTVRIAGERGAASLLLRISNPLSAAAARTESSGNSLAQDNVRERLTAFFGKRARLEVEANTAEYCVILRFPYRPKRI